MEEWARQEASKVVAGLAAKRQKRMATRKAITPRPEPAPLDSRPSLLSQMNYHNLWTKIKKVPEKKRRTLKICCEIRCRGTRQDKLWLGTYNSLAQAAKAQDFGAWFLDREKAITIIYQQDVDRLKQAVADMEENILPLWDSKSKEDEADEEDKSKWVRAVVQKCAKAYAESFPASDHKYILHQVVTNLEKEHAHRLPKNEREWQEEEEEENWPPVQICKVKIPGQPKRKTRKTKASSAAAAQDSDSDNDSNDGSFYPIDFLPPIVLTPKSQRVRDRRKEIRQNRQLELLARDLEEGAEEEDLEVAQGSSQRMQETSGQEIIQGTRSPVADPSQDFHGGSTTYNSDRGYAQVQQAYVRMMQERPNINDSDRLENLDMDGQIPTDQRRDHHSEHSIDLPGQYASLGYEYYTEGQRGRSMMLNQNTNTVASDAPQWNIDADTLPPSQFHLLVNSDATNLFLPQTNLKTLPNVATFASTSHKPINTNLGQAQTGAQNIVSQSNISDHPPLLDETPVDEGSMIHPSRQLHEGNSASLERPTPINNWPLHFIINLFEIPSSSTMPATTHVESDGQTLTHPDYTTLPSSMPTITSHEPSISDGQPLTHQDYTTLPSSMPASSSHEPSISDGQPLKHSDFKHATLPSSKPAITSSHKLSISDRELVKHPDYTTLPSSMPTITSHEPSISYGQHLMHPGYTTLPSSMPVSPTHGQSISNEQPLTHQDNTTLLSSMPAITSHQLSMSEEPLSYSMPSITSHGSSISNGWSLMRQDYTTLPSIPTSTSQEPSISDGKPLLHPDFTALPYSMPAMTSQELSISEGQPLIHTDFTSLINTFLPDVVADCMDLDTYDGSPSNSNIIQGLEEQTSCEPDSPGSPGFTLNALSIADERPHNSSVPELLSIPTERLQEQIHDSTYSTMTGMPDLLISGNNGVDRQFRELAVVLDEGMGLETYSSMMNTPAFQISGNTDVEMSGCSHRSQEQSSVPTTSSAANLSMTTSSPLQLSENNAAYIPQIFQWDDQEPSGSGMLQVSNLEEELWY